jgi:putative tryptophan/tyrosine transport system substrate-binding protein
MTRREFIAGLAGAAAWPLVAPAQPPKRPTIGFLGNSASSSAPLVAAFVGRLRELGWVEGRNISIEYRWTDGNPERVAEIAAEFVRRNVHVIHTTGNEMSLAVKEVTSVIPIVFGVAGDPVETGLVASLARPGGNVTGLSNQLPDAAGKRIELLREIVPGLRRLAIMAHVNPLSSLDVDEVKKATESFGLDVITLEIRQQEDIARAFDALKGNADALYVVNSNFLNPRRMRIIPFVLVARMPAIFATREWVEDGGLLSYGTNVPNLFRRSADYVDKILRGAKPADLPVEQPIKFDLVVNLNTAKAIGLTVPTTLLARADEVIE